MPPADERRTDERRTDERHTDELHPDRARELLERSDEEEGLARRYVDDREPVIDPVGELPGVGQRMVHQEPPELLAVDDPHCGATGRMRDAPVTGGSYMDQRYPVPCLLPAGHAGPHIAQWRWEAPRTWSIWAWD